MMNVVDGYVPEKGSHFSPLGIGSGSLGIGALTLDFTGMPPVTVSLIQLAPGGIQPGVNFFLETWISGGTSWVRFRVPEGTQTELVLYDMAGRRITTLWEGTNQQELNDIAVRRNGLPSGLYFVILAAEGEFLSEKVILLR